MMKLRGGALALAPTDLSHFLGCRHRTALDMLVASGQLRKPAFDDPQLEAMFQRGTAHEQAYVATLAASGGRLVDLSDNKFETERAVTDTLDAMRDGAGII